MVETLYENRRCSHLQALIFVRKGSKETQVVSFTLKHFEVLHLPSLKSLPDNSKYRHECRQQ